MRHHFTPTRTAITFLKRKKRENVGVGWRSGSGRALGNAAAGLEETKPKITRDVAVPPLLKQPRGPGTRRQFTGGLLSGSENSGELAPLFSPKSRLKKEPEALGSKLPS